MHFRRYRRRTSDVRQHHQEAGRPRASVLERGAPVHVRHERRRGCHRRACPRVERGMPHRTGISVVGNPIRPQVRVRPRRGRRPACPCPGAGPSAGRRVLPCRLATARPGRVGTRNTLCRAGLRRPWRPHHHQRWRWFPHRICNRRTGTRHCDRLHHDRTGTPFRFEPTTTRGGAGAGDRRFGGDHLLRGGIGAHRVPTAGAGYTSTSAATAASPKPRTSTFVTGCGPIARAIPSTTR